MKFSSVDRTAGIVKLTRNYIISITSVFKSFNNFFNGFHFCFEFYTLLGQLKEF
jgi:hypothetical protein